MVVREDMGVMDSSKEAMGNKEDMGGSKHPRTVGHQEVEVEDILLLVVHHRKEEVSRRIGLLLVLLPTLILSALYQRIAPLILTNEA